MGAHGCQHTKTESLPCGCQWCPRADKSFTCQQVTNVSLDCEVHDWMDVESTTTKSGKKLASHILKAKRVAQAARVVRSAWPGNRLVEYSIRSLFDPERYLDGEYGLLQSRRELMEGIDATIIALQRLKEVLNREVA